MASNPSLFSVTRQEADRWREVAREHEREARRLREIARKIEDPPEGTQVQILAPGSVRFVTDEYAMTRTLHDA